MQITILITEHHNGRDVYPCATYERAWERLDQYVLEWWGSARGKIASERVAPTPGNPASMTRDQRIETFFNYWEDKRREFYEIETYEVLGEVGAETGRVAQTVWLILPDDDDDIPDQYRYDDPGRVYARLWNSRWPGSEKTSLPMRFTSWRSARIRPSAPFAARTMMRMRRFTGSSRSQWSSH